MNQKSYVSLKKSCVPSIYCFHVHHISDGWPINPQSAKVWFVNYSLPVFMICSQLIVWISEPFWKSVKPLRPFLRPVSATFFNSCCNFVKTCFYRSVPVERMITKANTKKKKLKRVTSLNSIILARSTIFYLTMQHLDFHFPGRRMVFWLLLARIHHWKSVSGILWCLFHYLHQFCGRDYSNKLRQSMLTCLDKKLKKITIKNSNTVMVGQWARRDNERIDKLVCFVEFEYVLYYFRQAQDCN